MAVELEEKSKFIVCEHCLGQGKINNKTCEYCKGYGVAVFYDNKLWVWTKILDAKTRAYHKTTAFFNKVFNISVFVLASLSFLWGAYKLWQIFYLNNNFDWQSFINNFNLLWIYLALLLYNFLYFRYLKEQVNQLDLQKLKNKKNKEVYNIDNFQEAFNSNIPIIDASKYLTKDAVFYIEESYILNKQVLLPEIVPLHLFAILVEKDQELLEILLRLNLSKGEMIKKIAKALFLLLQAYEKKIQYKSSGIPYNLNYKKILIYSVLDAYNSGFPLSQTLNLFYSLSTIDYFIRDYNLIQEILEYFNLSEDKIENVIEWIKFKYKIKNNLQRFKRLARLKPRGNMDRAMTAIYSPYVEAYTEDYTEKAILGYFAPVVKREKLMQDIFNTIESTHNSILLVGHDGVGKTSILEYLAQLMVMEDVPVEIQDKRLLVLDIAKLLSSVDSNKVLNAFQEILYSIAKAGNIVLAIENIENLINSRDSGGVNLLDVLLKYLDQHYFYCIATVNPENYLTYVENGPLLNVMNVVEVDELKGDDAIQVIESKSSYIEYKYQVYLSYDAIVKTVELTDKFFYDKYLPDKALKTLEEVALRVQKSRGVHTLVLAEDVASFIAEKTGIPLTQLKTDESEKLLNLEEEIHKRVIGQDEAVKMLAQSLRRARVELRDEKRPIVNLLFLGPTGVGKTELAKAVAEVYFGAEDRMIRFDMSEYQDKSSINRLIGGNRESGLLTEAVRRQPFALLLFDELEKAHPDILNIFLQILDDGRLTDGQGRTVDFTNTIIIATSNAGAKYIQKAVKEGKTVEEIKEYLLENELLNYYRPEFLNRFDGILVFKPLTYENLIDITKLLLNKVADRLAKKHIHIEFTDDLVKELARLGYDPEFGARPLRRTIQEYVEDSLANYLLTAKIGARDKVIFDKGPNIKIEKISRL